MKTILCTLVFASSFLAAIAGAAETPAKRDALEMDEITVTGTRREMLLSDATDVLLVITRREIDELNPSSTGELLQYVTGASVETGTGSGLPKRNIVGLNGLPANYTLVLVDGVRLLSEHIHTGRNLELIPPEMIERIEIMRGAASAQYGADAIGGVINIITRKCADVTETSIQVAAGMYDTYEGGAGWMSPVSEKVRLSMFVGREQSQGLPIKEPAHRVGNMGYEQFNLLARVDIDVTEATTAFGWLNWVDNRMDWQGDESDSELVTGVVGLSHPICPTFNLFTQVSYSVWEASRSSEKNELAQPEAYVTWKITDAHTLVGGFDYKDHQFTRTAVMDSDQDTFGAFVQHEWRISDRLTLMTALRYDDVEALDAVCSPKASVLYSPVWPVRLRASVSRGFHAPTPQELHEEGYGHGGQALRFGNPDLDPEYSTTCALGVELFPGRPLEVMLYGHYSHIDDMIVPVYEGPWDEDPAKDVWRRMNIERAHVYGGEVKARYTPFRNLRFEGGYSYTDNEEADSGRQLPYSPGSTLFLKALGSRSISPDWTCSGFVGLQSAFDRSAWSWKPAEGAPEDDPSGLTTDLEDYQNLDAGISLAYRETFRFYLNVYNILGEDIENLDDLFTVLDGEPVVKGGFRCDW